MKHVLGRVAGKTGKEINEYLKDGSQVNKV
jgi:hypothetical protein